jgi:NADPH-dependent glutamate synthase beta subunit-like oxidoreductase/NAD(P)H-flavin reductase
MTQELSLAFGFRFADLYAPARLADLTAAFDAWIAEKDPAAATKLAAYRAARGKVPAKAVSDAIVGAAPHLSSFVARLFGVEAERERLRAAAAEEQLVFEFKREVVKRRVQKRAAEETPLATLRPAFTAVLSATGVEGGERADEHAAVAALWPYFSAWDRLSHVALKGAPTAEDQALADRARSLLARAKLAAPAETGDRDAVAALVLAALLTPVERFLKRWIHDHEEHHGEGGEPHPWVSLRFPRKLEFPNELVALRRPDPKLPELARGPEANRRERDGFVLTDRRMKKREVLSEVDYCLLCHAREKDSCSTGFVQKDGSYRPNPLGVPLAGCPLDEKISEAHTLAGQGDPIGTLALIAIDNPMCPGTGHRICNDCMKACVFQKQDPVNIPQVETDALTTVLDLPWGFEIYGLLTRWNPLHPTRQHPRPYTGKNVLVVGLGPAGYTLTHHLLREGFGVVAIDGLKIEPLPGALVPAAGLAPTPIKDWRKYYVELDERSMLGFGGVSEYGITVRWDKNFLTVIAATLMRWETLRVHGGVRFGGTLDLDDAWELGFDHVAICAGAGKPTLVDIPNGMIRGIRQASDFLMALQLTGAYRRSSLANLQVRLPAVVIGGGLTAIDTATELAAYYIVQCEKTLDRFETLAASKGSTHELLATFDTEEREILGEAVAHGHEIRGERLRAKVQGREPRFQQLLSSWGGVTIAYRRTLAESPAYRLNHEEVIKSLEEGITYVECVSPKEAVADEFGSVKGLKFDRMKLVDGKLVATGETVDLPARTVCVAAGTSPNATYERERKGSFTMDPKTKAFAPHRMERGPDGTAKPVPDPKGFFTSYAKNGRCVSFYGDNLPAYAGSVVKAMASAKDGYPHVVELFEAELAQQDGRDRTDAWKKHADRVADLLDATVHEVKRLTPTITELVVRAPLAARKFKPGQFYRLQNYEAFAARAMGIPLTTEGIALTGAWTDPERGLLSMIILELGVSSRLCATFRKGERIVAMGPTGTPTEIPKNETVLLAGGGLGNAVLFSIGRAMRQNGCKVIYFAGYRDPRDVFRRDDIEASADQVIWACDRKPEIQPRRPQDRTFLGNMVQAMAAFARGELGPKAAELKDATRFIVIGSDRMMNAVREARHAALEPFLKPDHVAVGSINSPMQCMMKEICAQCLQRHVDPKTGKQLGYVFSCFNQDQALDTVDFGNLAARLRQSTMQEKLSSLYLEYLLTKQHVARI